MEFHVTKEDINKGKAVDIYKCMLGLCMKRAFPNKNVTIYSLLCVDGDRGIELKDLKLNHLYEQAKAFDDWKGKRGPKPKPFSFHLSAECFMRQDDYD